MVTSVSTAEARARREAGVLFVDVLPPSSFASEHIAGAVNVPLADLTSAPAGLDPQAPLVVYCYDHQ